MDQPAEVTVVGPKQALALAKDTFNGFMEAEATWKAAALSYFTVFALAPLLVLLLQVASFIWDPIEVRNALTGQFQALMGNDVKTQIETMMMSAEKSTASGSGFRIILSIAGLLFGATGAFVALQTALNQAWEVEPDPKSGGIKNFITKRFLSLGMVLGVAFLLLVSLAVTAALGAAGGALFSGLGEAFAQVLNFVLTFAVITVLFAAMFKVLPDAKVAWRDVWVGGIATALLFVVGKTLIGLYIGKSDPGGAFGAAGSLAVLLVWIYYTGVILLLGAEFTQAWMLMHGRDIEPEKGAVRIVAKKERIRGSTVVDAKAEDAEHAEQAKNEKARKPAPNVTPAMAQVQQEMADTRARMSDTASSLHSRVSEKVDDVKEKADPSRIVKENPWPALAAAVVAGVAISATRADEKLADATVEAAKRGSAAAADRASRLVEGPARQIEHELRAAADEMGPSA
ncbi:MAG TPA: YihY/virulence factor BrkB family protein [Gemmatimonadaceae bacterium]|nr:YihY/virulence factor BrkB family protein [Gemmatimonadaceae bacterium]